MKLEAKEWLNRALEDLKAARILLREGLYDLSAFHAHQAAEKALKALWVEKRSELPPRIHALQVLARELGLTDLLDSARFVSSVYYISRYPDAGPRLGKQDALDVLHHAERIVARIRDLL